jgi:hypothetical protein
MGAACPGHRPKVGRGGRSTNRGFPYE